MRTVNVNVYQYSELSDKAKERARDWYRRASADDDVLDSCRENIEEILTDDRQDEFEKICTILGVTLATTSVPLMNGKTRQKPKIYYTGFCSQGDGACFEGSYSNNPNAATEIREYAPQDETLHKIADDFTELQSRYNGTLTAGITHYGRYYNEMFVEINVDYDYPDDTTTITTKDEDSLKDYLRDIMRWMYKSLENEYNYRMSDEAIDESILCNEYEFTENGDLY